MDYLEKLNGCDRDKLITMDKYHKYHISCDVCSKYKSVTTIVNDIFPKFDSDEICKKILSKTYLPGHKYYNKTKLDILTMWEESAKLGTDLHLDIEKYFNNVSVCNNSKEYKFFLNFLNDYNFTPYRTEWKIWNEDRKIAGSIDFVCKMKNDEYVLCDWKRVADLDKDNSWNKFTEYKNIILEDTKYNHYTLQLNLYAYILREKYNINITKLLLVVLHPDNENYVLYPLEINQSLIEKLI